MLRCGSRTFIVSIVIMHDDEQGNQCLRGSVSKVQEQMKVDRATLANARDLQIHTDG